MESKMSFDPELIKDPCAKHSSGCYGGEEVPAGGWRGGEEVPAGGWRA